MKSICNILSSCCRKTLVGVSYENIKFSVGGKMMRLVDKGLEIGFYPCFHSGPLGEFISIQIDFIVDKYDFQTYFDYTMVKIFFTAPDMCHTGN